MRRLSIIDLATGHSAHVKTRMAQSGWSFNGEIYNYQELRRWLVERGHRMQTNSDLKPWFTCMKRKARREFARLRGMFAYAIWDAKRKR